jgi:hypothetical protein
MNIVKTYFGKRLDVPFNIDKIVAILISSLLAVTTF